MNLSAILMRRADAQMASTDWTRPQDAYEAAARQSRETRGMMPLTCQHPGCTAGSHVKGLCQSHYRAQYRATHKRDRARDVERARERAKRERGDA